MATDGKEGPSVSWANFVNDLVIETDHAWGAAQSLVAWNKPDGSRVTELDLRLDATVRICLARHYPDVSVLSEEIGMLTPTSHSSERVAIVDPIDGTESLIAGRDSWWVSVGLLESGVASAGVVYQPSTRRLHDSYRPNAQAAPGFIVGMSPDRLADDATGELRARLAAAGAQLIETPHAAEKVAAVLEGRASASLYIPSQKSPIWRSWDLAAGIALARSNGLKLHTLDGADITVDAEQTERSETWICACDEAVWQSVRAIVG